MKLRDWLCTERCKNCNTPLINQKVYTVRDRVPTGLLNAMSSEEPLLFDAVDCPRCGVQRILGRRYRRVDG